MEIGKTNNRVHVCVCDRDRKRERGKGERKKEREKERERERGRERGNENGHIKIKGNTKIYNWTEPSWKVLLAMNSTPPPPPPQIGAINTERYPKPPTSSTEG